MKWRTAFILLLLAALAWAYRADLSALIQCAGNVAAPVVRLPAGAPGQAEPLPSVAPASDPQAWQAQPSLDAVGLTNGQAAALGIVPSTGGGELTPGQLANCAYAQGVGRQASPQCPPNAAALLGQGR